MNEEGLTTIIHRDRHGTVKNTRELSVPLVHDIDGESMTDAVSQKGVKDAIDGINVTIREMQAAIETGGSDSSAAIAELQRQIDSIIAGSASASLTASKTVVYKGVDTTVTLTAKCTPAADEIVIKKGDTVVNSGSGSSLQATVMVNTQSDVTYKAVFTVSGNPREVSLTIKAVRPIYYGCGTTETDAQTEASVRTSPAGKYTIHVPSDNMRIYFVVPEGMSINGSAEGPIEFPLTGPTNTTRTVAGATVNYKVYQSNLLVAGDYTVTLT